MDLQLKRTKITNNGVFGELQDINGIHIAYTLEHAYLQPDGNFAAKIPTGTYMCQLGSHQLAHMTHTFQTYEIMNIPNHFNILFHSGNTETDSSGCVLLGEDQDEYGVLNSRLAFNKFMLLQNNVSQFQLVVINS
jgi:hypothetical protein